MAKKGKGGRKPRYLDWITDEGLIKLQGWARDGLTDVQIAHNMGIAPSTLYKWKNKKVEIRESLKVGKDVADRQVENALFKSAVSGNVTAMIFWLKNRKPKEWREKQEIKADVDTRVEVAIEYENPSKDE